MMINRRHWLLGAAGFLLTACGDRPYSGLIDAASFAIGGAPDTAIDFERARALPYASMTARLGKGPLSLIVLGEIHGEKLSWFSADRVILVTRRGRLMRTAGLPDNLLATRILDPDLAERPSPSGSTTIRRVVDLEEPSRYSVLIEGTCEPGATEEIDVAGRRIRATQIIERCRADTIGWSFVNRYWLDDRAFIWKSEQHTLPSLPPFELAVVKPAAL